MDDIQPGYKGILIARKPLANANCRETTTALKSLLQQSGIVPSHTYG